MKGETNASSCYVFNLSKKIYARKDKGREKKRAQTIVRLKKKKKKVDGRNVSCVSISLLRFQMISGERVDLEMQFRDLEMRGNMNERNEIVERMFWVQYEE